MGILNFEMTNDDTTSESTSTGNTRTTDFVLSPGLPELREEDPSEDIDIDSPLSDDVFSVMDFNISPLIKQELRSTIRNKRIGSGMGDIVIDHSPRGSAEVSVRVCLPCHVCLSVCLSVLSCLIMYIYVCVWDVCPTVLVFVSVSVLSCLSALSCSVMSVLSCLVLSCLVLSCIVMYVCVCGWVSVCLECLVLFYHVCLCWVYVCLVLSTLSCQVCLSICLCIP